MVKLIKKENKTVLLFGENTTDTDTSVILSEIKQAKASTVFAEVSSEVFSSLITAEVYKYRKILGDEGVDLDFSHLPQNLQDLLLLSLKPANTPPTENNDHVDFFTAVGQWSFYGFKKFKQACSFIADAFISLMHFINGKAIYRKKDFWFIFEDCSYKAIGITILVSFLVGLILAFVGALQLKSFGAGIYVASMVTLGMTRIMAAIMVGIIMAGRTGSSYAATLGTMLVNEEIDALKTLGIKVTDYLVAPRMVSLILTIPFLTLLADLLGILGGAVVGVLFLGISPTAYFEYSVKALDTTNVLVGLLHSVVYGVIISLCGCYEGLNAGRDADAVGKATTSAVVTSLVWMIVATGILTILMEIFGL